jgi:16S rRNA (cytosine967-C5)-methyltransferase
MQDEGSQLVAALVEAKPKEKVIDFCAGSGGKTLAVAAAMHNRGRLLAWDTSQTRLNQMPKRLTRAGVHNTQIRLLSSERDAFLKRHIASADWLLLDVPCTGTGTWRRSPDLKWRTGKKDLAEMQELQKNILESAARLVKPGGRLVYATCSLFAEENEDRIAAFLEAHAEFQAEPVTQPHIPESARSGGFLRLFPHLHRTDGFFAAVLRRE